MRDQLVAYRRHTRTCPHRDKGQAFSLCSCPIWIYGPLPDGTRIRQSLNTSDAATAMKRLAAIQRGEQPAPHSAGVTLNEAVADYIADCRKRNVRESTITAYRNTFTFFSSVLGPAPLAGIDIATLDEYARQRNIAPGTWKKELIHIRSLFKWAMARKLCPENPASLVAMPKVETLTTLPFEPDEIARLLDAADRITDANPGRIQSTRRRAKALLYALMYTGLRISDVACMERSKLDANGYYTIRRIQKTGVPLKVKLHPDAVRALQNTPSRNPRYFFWSGTSDLIGYTGSLRGTIARLGGLAGVPNAHPHRFRDTFAVELLTNGVDIRTVQKLLGHASVQTTERHYAHFVAAHQALLDRATATLDYESRLAARPALVHAR